MQRPILVLVIVLVALVALSLGVYTLLEKPALPGPETPSVVDPGATPKPANPGRATLEPETPRGTAQPVDQRAAANQATSFRYDNELVGEVVDASGKPIAGVNVTLTTFGAQVIFFHNDPRTGTENDRRAETDANGRFAFQSLEPRDRYRLVLQHAEYARYEGDTVPIPAQGQVREAPIVLRAGAVLSGTVKDEGGKPVADATVELDGLQYQISPYEAPDRLRASTNADGQYELRHVAPGTRMLTVKAAGFGTANVPGIEFDEKESAVTRDVVLKPAQSICGKAIAANGQGIPGVKVLAIGFNSAQQSARVETITNDKGEFCLEALQPGKYNVLGSCRGWRFKALPLAANTTNVVLEAVKEAEACGRVVDADTNQPIADFQVRLRVTYAENPVTQPIPDSLVAVTKAVDGAYCIPGVQATMDGGYVVEAMAPGYAPGFSATFSVEAGRTVTNLEVRLSHGGTLTGRVVDADGKPIPHALVATHDNEWTLDAFTIGLGNDYPTQATSASARTDAQGRFTLKNLTPEVYQITIEAAGHSAFEKKDLQVVFGQANDIGDVRLSSGGTVQGKLLDPSGKGYANGLVQLEALEGDRPRNYRTRTASDGAFTLSNVVPGTYRLTASSATQGVNPFEELQGKRSNERQITVSDGEDQRGVEISLNP
ncbi:MAG: carboxypeptidase regulatory-like domain-containing protein [Planctomycetes bacterium]|nr:carboxypeptidase regulatory-like domain-containing protein [Planctomycetota bacterium]